MEKVALGHKCDLRIGDYVVAAWASNSYAHTTIDRRLPMKVVGIKDKHEIRLLIRDGYHKGEEYYVEARKFKRVVHFEQEIITKRVRVV
jgi:hypothetical protein